MTKSFRPWKVDEAWLLPPSVQEFVPEGHAAHLVRDIVAEELDLSAILSTYEELRGYPPYHAAMMVALLLYAYSRGVYSSWRIARGCEERLDFQAVTALNRPDFRTISEFRRRHLAALPPSPPRHRQLIWCWRCARCRTAAATAACARWAIGCWDSTRRG
jgi:hypothetical protein